MFWEQASVCFNGLGRMEPDDRAADFPKSNQMIGLQSARRKALQKRVLITASAQAFRPDSLQLVE